MWDQRGQAVPVGNPVGMIQSAGVSLLRARLVVGCEQVGVLGVSVAARDSIGMGIFDKLSGDEPRTFQT